MKTFSKTLACVAAIAAIVIYGCKKADTVSPVNTVTTNTTTTIIYPEHYTSMNDFFHRNAVPVQTHTFNGNTSYSFTSPQGTIVDIPANAFVTTSFVPVTGPVTITFRDIYKKSDMLLTGVGTNFAGNGGPMKSGGEFFIKATSGGAGIILAAGQKISVTQPAALTGGIDALMTPFANMVDTTGAWAGSPPNAVQWFAAPIDSVADNASSYIFSLYSFANPADSGTWCNSDNNNYFSAYPQTSLTLHQTDTTSLYQTEVYLVFSGISSMVHVYYGALNNFPYSYAPVGLQCTVVAVGERNGVLYSSFTPITISTGMTVNFNMTATTTAAFEAQLVLLN